MTNDDTASHGKSLALSFLNECIDGNRLPRKALADEIGKSEQTFSKMTAGSQAFGLDDFGAMPRDLQVAFFKRYGKEVLGLEVTDLSLLDVAVQFMELFDQMRRTVDLARVVGRPVPAKAELAHVEQQRKAG